MEIDYNRIIWTIITFGFYVALYTPCLKALPTLLPWSAFTGTHLPLGGEKQL